MASSTTSSASDDKTLLSPVNLKEEKIRALKLLLSYAYAVKHHLRGEVGTDWPDYKDVLPLNFARFDEIGFGRTKNRVYSSINSGTTTQKARIVHDDLVTDASPTTPLLTDSHHTVEFHAYPEPMSLPLPMV